MSFVSSSYLFSQFSHFLWRLPWFLFVSNWWQSFWIFKFPFTCSKSVAFGFAIWINVCSLLFAILSLWKIRWVAVPRSYCQSWIWRFSDVMGSLDAEERPKTPDYCSLQKQSTQRDFHAYQLSLFLITQLGYLPVAGSLLSTTFFEPPLVGRHLLFNPSWNNPFAGLL